MEAHKVCKAELAVRHSGKQGTSLCKSCNIFSCKVVVSQKAAAVCVSFQSLVVQGAEEFVHIHFYTEGLCKFFEQVHPGI